MANNDDIKDIEKINERIEQKLIIMDIEKVKLNLNKIYNHLQLLENNVLLIANAKEQTEVAFKHMCELEAQFQNELICDCDKEESCCCNEASAEDLKPEFKEKIVAASGNKEREYSYKTADEKKAIVQDKIAKAMKENPDLKLEYVN